MTIDEAIKIAEDVAKQYHKAADECASGFALFPNRDDQEWFDKYEYSAEEHGQLAEWLEELKELRKFKTYIVEELADCDCNSIDEVKYRAYNKAIKDFRNEALAMIKEEQDTRYGYLDGMDIREIADKLKR